MSEQNAASAADRSVFVLPSGASGLPPDALLRFTEGLRANGDIFELPMAMGEDQPVARCVMLGHPTDIRQVLTNTGLVKGQAYDSVRPVLGDGVLTADGPKWVTNNRYVRPAFRMGQVTQMMGVMASAGSMFVEGLAGRIQDEPVVDLKKEMTDLTFATITDVLFGRHGQIIRDGLTYDDLVQTFRTIAQMRGGLSEEDARRNDEITQKLTDLMFQVIPAARKEPPNGTLLSILAHATDRATGDPLDETTIRDELVTFLFAGHETVGLTLTWMLNTLQDHPEVLRSMQQEIDEVLQGRAPDAETVPQLTFTRRVIDEVLRHRPPAPIVARQATSEVSLRERTNFEGDPVGLTIQPGDIVLAYIWGAHHHPDFWTDPGRFNPDRVLVEADRERIEEAYMPFIHGRRSCTGQYLAPAEAVIHAALLLQRFNFDILPEKEEIFPTAGITLQPSGPIHAQVTLRS